MEPNPELLRQIEDGHRRQSRRMTPEQKFRAGGDLFDEACRWTLAGIRRQYPAWTEAQALVELRHRLARARKRDTA